MTTFLVNEIYPCLQGEGLRLGMPSLLVRFQICNLRCTWCDTPYTHTLASDPQVIGGERQKQRFRRYKAEDLAKFIYTELAAKNLRNLILSGGEPTLQNISLLLDLLEAGGLHFNSLSNSIEESCVEVETNGTQIPHLKHKNFNPKWYQLVQWNVSPKGQNAGENWDVNALDFWANLASKKEHNVIFKFVVRSGDFFLADLSEVHSFRTTFAVPSSRIFLMPEGTTQQSQANCIALHNACLQEGFRYTPRLHVLLFGSQRGV